MCDLCENAIDRKTQPGSSRVKLWDMPRHYHCPIIGTCLSMGELKKIQRNSTLTLPPKPSDHQLHTGIVGQAEHNGAISHRVHKLLDKKYQRWVRSYGRLTTPETQRAFWRDALQAGDISGPFWALLSHQHSCRQLTDKALGDVHMLSHLQGASNRADLQRTASLADQVEELENLLDEQRLQFEQKMARQETLLAAQKSALQSMQQRLTPATPPEQQLSQELAEERQNNNNLRRKQDWLVSQLALREQRLNELEYGNQGLLEQLREVQQERDAMERGLNQLLASQSPEATCRDDEEIDLEGKRLAYIGGRTTLYPHLKSYVETLNGELVIHDGGQEDNRADLCSSLSAADLVFCPVDCVSHDACLRVKKFCKQHQKTFVLLRSASLSAFSTGLRTLQETGDTPPSDPALLATLQ